MDLDKDGTLDLVSGSYECHPKHDCAPLQFFQGKVNSPLSYREPIPIKTLSGALPSLESLKNVMRPGGRHPLFRADSSPGLEASRTKPNFVDINGDGHLDLIYGEFRGYFIRFDGTAAKGPHNFSDNAELLKDTEGNLLKVELCSSPHFIDWDGDKDLDLITGAANGAIYFSENTGTPKEPQWKALTEWLPPAPEGGGKRGHSRMPRR